MTEERPTRTETDSLGPIEVPDDALWAAQTQRALANFDVAGRPFPIAVVHRVATIKQAAATVNGSHPLIESVDSIIGAAIAAASSLVASGQFDDQFLIDAFQTGSGTSTNMNVNEVIATLATRSSGQPIHPNDHVNAGQSSNDVIPTAIHLAAMDAADRLTQTLELLATSLESQAELHADTVKAGRTHLMDAAPVTVGLEFAGWAAQVRYHVTMIDAASAGLGTVALGGTAVGTGLNRPAGWASLVMDELGRLTGRALSAGASPLAEQSDRSRLVAMSSSCRGVATTLCKVANDLRLLGSGPFTGFGELVLPAVQPGSSIMPGKVNPVICEAVIQGCLSVFGKDATVGFAAASGQLELTATMGVMALDLLDSLDMMARAAAALAIKCVDGIIVDDDQCRRNAERSPAILTALVPELGYDVVAKAASRLAADPTLQPAEALAAVGVEAQQLTDLAHLIDPAALARPVDA